MYGNVSIVWYVKMHDGCKQPCSQHQTIFLSKKKKSHASSPSPSEARLCFEKETNNKSVYIISVSVCRCFLGQFVFFLFVSQWIPVILSHSPTQGWIQKGRKYMKRNQKWVYLSKLKEKGNKRSYTGGKSVEMWFKSQVQSHFFLGQIKSRWVLS